MALPLEPESGLFPGTLVEPFVNAPAVADLADTVLSRFDEFRYIEEAIRDRGLSIGYVFETKPFDMAAEEFKPHTIAKVNKASPLWRCLTDRHLVIQFRETFWNAFDDNQRQAVLHHEFTHVETELDDAGRLKVSLRPHDVEDFRSTIRRFGTALPGRAAFVKAYLDWQHEQDAPTPTPLRSVHDLLMTEDGEKAMAAAAAEQWGDQATVDRDESRALRVTVDTTKPARSRKDQALADATAHRLGRSKAQAAARPAPPPDDRVGELHCQGSNHVPGHTPGCPSYVVS